MDADDEYDEFGNYIGGDEGDLTFAADDEFGLTGDLDEIAQEADLQSAQSDDEYMDVAEDRAIVLSEDKQYYPDAADVFKGVKTVLVDEDTQDVAEPIVNPMKTQSFSVLEKEAPALNYSGAFMSSLMDSPSLIRNVALVGQLHHGKTLLADLLVQSTQEKAWGNTKEVRYCDTRKDEQARELSIKATALSLVLQNVHDKSYMCHLVDCPGHVDFNDEMEASLRLVDGCVLVVDCIEGVMLTTDRAIRACVRSGVNITLCISKLDRMILELKIPPQDAYYKIRHTIEEINSLVDKYSHGFGGNASVKRISPELGNVCFSSGQHSWVFTLESFAMQYCDKHRNSKVKASLGATLAPSDLAPRLWGDWYFDPFAKKLVKKARSKPSDVRTFIEFILDPLYKLYSHVLGDEPAVLVESLKTQLGMKLTKEEASVDPKPLLRTVMKKFFGDTKGVVSMMVNHIPSPLESCRKKIMSSYHGNLGSGDAGRNALDSMLACDGAGPLVMHVTKLVSSTDGKKFYALARIYSGTLRNTGIETVRVLGEDYSPEDQEDSAIAIVDNVSVSVARFSIDVAYASAGNLILVEGIDAPIKKTATVFESSYAGELAIFSRLQFDIKATVRIALEPMKPSELPKLIDALRSVCKSYPAIETKVEESGEHVIIGPGELGLDCALHDLRNLYSNIEVMLADPIVNLCETVVETSGMKASGVTLNGKNRFSIISEPLDKGLAQDIEYGMLRCGNNMAVEDQKYNSQFLQKQYNWDLLSSRSIWAFGSEENSPNLFLNDTLPSEVDRKHLNTVKESIVQGFRWSTREGPLCDEPMRNVKMKLLDANIAMEPIYRGGGQIIPTARRVAYSSFLTAAPRLMEPVYEVEVQVPADMTHAVRQVLQRRRGYILSETPKPGAPLYIMRGMIPIIESFGVESDLRSSTQGQAFMQKIFDHWSLVPGDPLNGDIILHPLEPAPKLAMARDFMIKLRRRKGLSDDISIVKYFDEDMLAQLRENNGLASLGQD